MTKCHVFTDIPVSLFHRQFPNHRPSAQGIEFSFGLDVPDDIDLLIVYGRASYSIPTHLPRERVVFIAAEPDVIHRYSTGFQNQFGLVVTTSPEPISTRKMQTNYCTLWFVGIDFGKDWETDPLDGYDTYRDLTCPEKTDKISIITSDKATTEYHRKRLAFIQALTELIPDHLEIFGTGTRSVDDKAEALLPYRYHLALENGAGPDTWTEKLADPFLCWSFPFYAGCENADAYFPGSSFQTIDLNDPEGAAKMMVDAITSGRWEKAKDDIAVARERILERYNFASLLVRIVQDALSVPVVNPPRGRWVIKAERAMRPEKGHRGTTVQWLMRSAFLRLHPGIELYAARAKQARALRKRKRST